MKQYDSTTCIICCDGSAMISPKGCIDASAGIVAIPVLHTDEDDDNYYEDILSGGYGSFGDDEYLDLRLDLAQGFRGERAGGLISTPFDAELLAGLTALTISKSLILKQSENLNIIVLTDSRSLLKVLRSGVNSDLENRKIMWQLASELNYESKDDDDDDTKEDDKFNASILEIDWTPGHPERREFNSTLWSANDQAIYAADMIAKGDGDLMYDVFDAQDLIKIASIMTKK